MSRMLLVLLVALAATNHDLPDPPAKIQVVGSATQAQSDRLDEALAAFEQAGLDLPETTVRFHPGDDPCGGNLGRFAPRSRGPHEVRVCSDLAFVVAHELAHAWVHENVDDEAKAAYLALRGLAVWNDRNVPWNERGTEDAAFVIQQVLTIDPVTPDTREWRDRYVAFEALIGN